MERIAERLRCSVIDVARNPRWAAFVRAAWAGEVGYEDRTQRGG